MRKDDVDKLLKPVYYEYHLASPYNNSFGRA